MSIWTEVLEAFLQDKKRDFPGGPPLYFDLENPVSERYDGIQNNIESQVNHIYKELRGLKGSEVSQLIGTLEQKKKESALKEEQLLKKTNYKNLSYNKRIELATALYLGVEKTKDGIKVKDNAITYLGYFLKSTELYNTLKARGAGEILSRTAITGEKQSDAFVNDDAINILKNVFIEEGKERIRNEGESQIVNNIINIFNEKNKRIKNKKQTKSTQTAREYSSITRGKIRKILNEHNKNNPNNKLEGIVVYRVGDSVRTEFVKLGAQISASRQNTLLAVFSSDSSTTKNSWYLAFKNNPNSITTIQIFTSLVRGALQNCDEFNVINIGLLKINKERKDSMLALLDAKQINSFIKTAGANLDKFFNPANSNAFLSGFLGELGNFYLIKGNGFSEVTLSGSAYEEIGGGNLKAQSTTDLTIESETGDIYGINIKNYVSKADGSYINLYKSDTGIDIFSNYISKYFTQQEIVLARYLTLNIGQTNLPVVNSLIETVGSVALKNLPNFLRITNAEGTVTNLFFVLNNICYPTSYIYDLLIRELRGKQKIEQINEFFTFSADPTKIPLYEDENEARAKDMKEDVNGNILKESLQDQSFLNKYKTNKNLYIQFKGLKINLMNYNIKR